jgi:transcriptional regulator with XRE-family HTH domain
MTDWPRLLRELKEAGVTQTQIAELAEVSQGTVSDLATGRREETSYRLGKVIERLHDTHVKAEKGADGEGPRTPIAMSTHGRDIRPERDGPTASSER